MIPDILYVIWKSRPPDKQQGCFWIIAWIIMCLIPVGIILWWMLG